MQLIHDVRLMSNSFTAACVLQATDHGLLPVAVPLPFVLLGLVLGMHPSLALLLSLIILLVGLLSPHLCLLPASTSTYDFLATCGFDTHAQLLCLASVFSLLGL